MENRSKSVLEAMLADDDISLEPSWTEMEPSWPKMTSRIDFSSISGAFLGTHNAITIDPKMELFADVSRNFILSEWS